MVRKILNYRFSGSCGPKCWFRAGTESRLDRLIKMIRKLEGTRVRDAARDLVGQII